MTDETKVYDERAREMAEELSAMFYPHSSQSMEDVIFLKLKSAYADGCIDTLKARLAITHEAG